MSVKSKSKILLKKTTALLFKLLIACLFITLLQVLFFKWIDPFTSSIMIQRKIGLLFSGKKDKSIKYKWYDYDDISKNVALAVVTEEDQNFPFHIGFVFEQINKAIKDRQEGKRLRGASTISQQVAKNLFLWEGKSFIRKGFEAYYTILIEFFWSKRRILEIYLNIAELGKQIFGVGKASEIYFKKHPSELTRSEAALLAAVLPNPKRYSVTNPSKYVRKRQEWILRQMKALGGAAYLKDL